MAPVSVPQSTAQPAGINQQGYTLESMEMVQPRVGQTIDTQQLQESLEPELSLRGGEDCDGWCRGRFCFIIPCPIPIKCCFIPL
ncbi:uncharacterized protein FFB20_02689 [Fusarium fujikuroi]|nr:uncharacterized protein FFB20_02689 [Fusarium fujikuroi]SCN83472.1 uncharacterized protein FFM5_03034 [Fusarium fujikuroi]SCO23599.1 uncharacterized protein FFE2_15663 [Fusarium fujikuroi]SCO33709.1 uncharacterized protein FFNC_03390 [Fusarium fujikuroi]SCV61067.1 uncharacterized protein FFFS_15636 [Fusarium fujikuroi]